MCLHCFKHIFILRQCIYYGNSFGNMQVPMYGNTGLFFTFLHKILKRAIVSIYTLFMKNDDFAHGNLLVILTANKTVKMAFKQNLT